MNPHRVNGDMSTLVVILQTSHPEGLKVPNYTNWSGGSTARSFCGRKRKTGPEQPSQLPELPVDDSECRRCSGCTNAIVRGKMLEPLLSRYSSWERLRKAISWLVPLKKYLVGLLDKDPDSIPKVPLTVNEVIAAESVIIKAVQHDAFPAELAVVGQRPSGNQKKSVPRSSPTRKLNSFVAEGMLRPPNVFCMLETDTDDGVIGSLVMRFKENPLPHS
ncbi:hypothetical protein AWC38_SpisGene16319 [Stylophora pistillata]|uniref:Uncharacterized protein n=1 Tax=Stylophora pistillata TaxID=50429 RepID=A0A2B4RNU2_STYPI|nr:hypothetical protein AWC38_SpisGene16319 [Stylophora pistillata]